MIFQPVDYVLGISFECYALRSGPNFNFLSSLATAEAHCMHHTYDTECMPTVSLPVCDWTYLYV